MMAKLDELQSACEKVLSLLKDRQEGLFSWNMFLVDECQKLTETLLDGGSVCPVCTGPLDKTVDPSEITTPFTSDRNPPQGEKKTK